MPRAGKRASRAVLADPEPDPLPSITVAPVQQTGPGHPGALAALERTAVNNAELRINAQTVLAVARASRPGNTTRNYAPKQLEFRQFCGAKGYPDGDTVTEEKVLLFLVQEVTSRPLRKRSRALAAEISLEETRLSWRSVRGYVTALTDLWQSQRALHINSNPSPREESIRGYIKALQRKDTDRKRAQFMDKGTDTLLDGYGEAELKRLAGELWSHGASSGALECHHRTLVDFLIGHYMLSRGAERRDTELSDLSTFELPGEGPTRCMPLIYTTRNSKTNQYGRIETAAAIRNRDPLICMLSAVAFYLLVRWDLSPEPFPDFQERSKWYNIPLIKASGSGPEPAPLSYNSQRNWVDKAFQYTGIISTKKTHIGRTAGAKTAELKGVSEAQIRRAGRWNQDQMVGCYLSALPRKFIRIMAGHPATIGCFEVPRARLAPPQTLLSTIWPELDQWIGRFGPGPDQIIDLAAGGFIDLLVYLREVVIQDSAFLMDLYPASPIWNHPVFQHPDYRVFIQELRPDPTATALEGSKPGQLALLTQAIPQLTDYLQTAEAHAQTRSAGLVASFKAEIQGLEARLSGTTQSVLRQVLADSSFQLKLPSPTISDPPPALALDPALDLTLDLALDPAPDLALDPAPDLALDPAPDPALWSGLDPPRHRMSRSVTTVEGLWQEWTQGVSGQPSIQALDNHWGSRWRAGRRAELQWYSLRSEVIREIHRVAQSRRISTTAAVHAVGLEQRQSLSSLDRFCKRLRAGRLGRLEGRSGG